MKVTYRDLVIRFPKVVHGKDKKLNALNRAPTQIPVQKEQCSRDSKNLLLDTRYFLGLARIKESLTKKVIPNPTSALIT
jgi:hypothetical protein